MDLDVVDEVYQAVLDQGGLSKAEICAAWGLDDDDYSELVRRLSRRKELQKGPKGTGGFRTRTTGSATKGGGIEIQLDEAWQQSATARLAELLTHRQLEDALEGLVSTIRYARKQQTGEDRRGTKDELAAALVIQHGQDLFRNMKVRVSVGKAVRRRPPGRWHPGKGGALRFVDAAGFPTELAGLPTPSSLPSYHLLQGRVPLGELRDYQKEVQRKLLSRLYAPGSKGLMTLPTGAGKTRVAVESLRYWLNDRWDHRRERADHGQVIWLAHTEELCEQAVQCFRQVWEDAEQQCPLLLARFWGRYSSKSDELQEVLRQSTQLPSVLVSTPHRLVRLIRDGSEASRERLAAILGVTGLIVIDEAHRAAARSYRDILKALQAVEHPVSVIGLTATPYRMEYDPDDPEAGTRELKEIFGELLEPSETLGPNMKDRLAQLQERGVLATPQIEELDTALAMRVPAVATEGLDSDEADEKVDRVLALRADRSPRRLVILERLLEVLGDENACVLYFGPSVRDAECMAYLLRAEGVSAAVVSGGTRDVVRRELIDEFKRGTQRVLCNCEVLTTGFDAPRVSHLVMARPTVSQVLYEQMVGRGLRGREFGGTDTCVIVNCVDRISGAVPELGYESFRRVWG